MNNELIIIGIFSIVILLYLFYKNEKGGKKFKYAGARKEKKKHQYKVRINPIPLTESNMSNKDRFYETTFVKSALKKETYEEPKILVLLCHADWCHNCTPMKAIFDELKQENPISQVKFATLEEDEKNEYSHYGKNIYAYPTVLIDNAGTITRYTGARNKTAILNYINEDVLD